jgi:hypothetical protein
MKKMKLNICLLHISHHYGVLAFCRLLNITLLHSQRKLYIQLVVHYFLLKLSQKEMVDDVFYVA